MEQEEISNITVAKAAENNFKTNEDLKILIKKFGWIMCGNVRLLMI